MKRRDHLRLVSSEPAATAAQSWDRSFPAETVDGFRWVLDVLDDLAAFTGSNGLPEIAEDIEQMRGRVADRLPGPRTR